MNVFLLIVDMTRYEGKSDQIDALLETHKLVSAWSTPFLGTYFLKSEVDDAHKLSSTFDKFLQSRGYIVVKSGYYSNLINGRINPEIWSFINVDNDDVPDA